MSGSNGIRGTERDSGGIVAFGDFELDLEARILSRNGERIDIQRKPLVVLVHLIEAAPRLVPRDELLDEHFGRSVNEESLTRCVSTIRKILGDTRHPPLFVETHRGQGYRFIGSPRSRTRIPKQTKRPKRAVFQAIAAAALLVVVGATAVWQRSGDPGSQQRVDRIAVLPVDVAGDDEGWFSIALSDHLVETISKIEGMTVIGPGPFGAGAEAAATAGKLNVDAVLTSRFIRLSDGSTLTARLESVSSGDVIWSTTVESTGSFGSYAQVADLAQEIAARVRPSVQLQTAGELIEPAAYREYLQGRFYLSRRTSNGLYAAIAAFERSLEIEPGFVGALLGAAECWLLLPLYGAIPPIDSLPRARELAREALEAEPDSARARSVLGVVAMQFDWDWDSALSLLSEAATLNPNDPSAHQRLGELHCYRSRFDECARHLRRALDLDPLSPVLHMQQGSPAYYSGNYESALSTYTEASRNQPEFALGRYVRGLAHAGMGNWAEAIAAYEASLPELGLEIAGGPLIYALARLGEADKARQLLAQLEVLSGQRYVPPSKLAIAYLGLGEREQAHSQFLRATEVHDDRLVYFKVDVHTRRIAGDRMFHDILERTGLAADTP